MAAREQGTNVRPGLYIELKHPTHFLAEGRNLAGEPIGLERLEARPIATLSIEAQERREQLERQYSDRG